MLSAKIVGRGKVGLIKTTKPKPADWEILVRLRACGICGTDIEKLTAQTETPGILGHELVGEVSEMGMGVDEFKVGQRVFVHHHVSCGKCYFCLHRDETQCPSFRETNIFPSGFSEYFLVPQLNVERGGVVLLPREIEDQEAVFIEPLACCLKALSRVQFDTESSVCVLGCGSMGLLHIKLLKLFGVTNILGIDLLDARLKTALKCGARDVGAPNEAASLAKKLSSGLGPDVAILATGNPRAFTQSLELVRKGGAVLLFGAPPKLAKEEIRMGKLFYDEVKLIPSYSTTEPFIRKAVTLLLKRRLAVSDLVTHTFELTQIVRAFDESRRGRSAIKVLVIN